MGRRGLIAFGTALTGFIVAVLFYLVRVFNPETVKKGLFPIHGFLINKWFFDELYDLVFVKPTLILAQVAALIDRKIIDWLADNSVTILRPCLQNSMTSSTGSWLTVSSTESVASPISSACDCDRCSPGNCAYTS